MESSGSKMKKTPFGAFLTPALTNCPPAETRIAARIAADGGQSQNKTDVPRERFRQTEGGEFVWAGKAA